MANAKKDSKTVFAELIDRAWRDPAFKQRLLAQPAEVFAAAGIPVPEGKTIKVVEETNTVGYFILPAPPGGGGGSLSDFELDDVAGGDVAFVTRLGGISKKGLFVNKKATFVCH